jgi:hypothetical protein
MTALRSLAFCIDMPRHGTALRSGALLSSGVQSVVFSQYCAEICDARDSPGIFLE